jgi:hypothetical protein
LEEHRLKVFENTVLRNIFGPKRDEVKVGWRKLHNEELHKLYFSPNVIRMINSAMMDRVCSTHGGEEECIYDMGWKARRKETTRKT